MTSLLVKLAESNTPGMPAPGCVPVPTKYSPSSALAEQHMLPEFAALG